MKRILLSLMLASASSFSMAQNVIEQAKKLIEAYGGVISTTTIQPKQDEEAVTPDPLEGQSDDYIRGYNDSRREAYAEQQRMFAQMGQDFSQAAMSQLKLDSVGIYVNMGSGLVAMKHVDAFENRTTLNDFAPKWILTYKGKTSNYQFTGGKATFRVYFTHDRNSISEYYNMFSSDLTIDDFVVCHMKVKGNKREFIGARHGQRIIGYGSTKSKAEEAKDVKVDWKKVSENIYDMTVEGEPGEYCLTWNEKARSSSVVFDFTIK